MLRGAVDAHVKANTAEFTGSSSGAAECCAAAAAAALQQSPPPSLPASSRSGHRSHTHGCCSAAPGQSPFVPHHSLPSSVHVRALGDPMKLAISVWYEFCHNGVDGGRISRARWAGRHPCSCSLLVLPSVVVAGFGMDHFMRWSAVWCAASRGVALIAGRQTRLVQRAGQHIVPTQLSLPPCPPCRTALYIVIASALSAAGVQFTLPPFSAGATGEAEALEEAQMAAALEAADLAAGAGLPPINITGLRQS